MNKDNYPETFEFEFERKKLCKYLRTIYFLMWNIITFFATFLAVIAGIEEFDFLDINGSIISLITTLILVFLISGTICSCLYFLFAHRTAKRIAETQKLVVEGTFLRVVNNSFLNMDRKTHFRALVDYTITSGKLMRQFGLSALCISTTSPQVMIRIVGLKDCEKVRKILAEIDAIREV